jgi:hypothetical protein
LPRPYYTEHIALTAIKLVPARNHVSIKIPDFNHLVRFIGMPCPLEAYQVTAH